MNRQVLGLCLLTLLLGCQQVSSTNYENENCALSEEDEDLCASYCYKSLKRALGYIIELKEQIKTTAQENVDKEKEIIEMRRTLYDLSQTKDKIKALNQHIEDLRRTNDILIEKNRVPKNGEYNSNVTRNQQKEIEELSRKAAKYLNESIAIQDRFNKEIEILRKQSLTNREQMEELNSLKYNMLQRELVKCKDGLSKGCKGFSTGIHLVAIPGLLQMHQLCNGDIDGGGWIVIQKRFVGQQNLHLKNWTEYRNGFGILGAEFFIGLQPLHLMTYAQPYELYIQTGFIDGSLEISRYDYFRIGGEDNDYTLESLGAFTGTGTDIMSISLNQKFRTFDRYNGHQQLNNCPIQFGWWSYDCNIPLKDHYYESHPENSQNHMIRKPYIPETSLEMLVRPKS